MRTTETLIDSSGTPHLLEEGVAALSLGQGRRPPARSAPERFDVIVIGGGQAGLSVGYFLAQTGLRYVILDAHARIGDTWRQRWDSLRLFTPARLDGLAGMPFPAPPHCFPTKDEMAAYLEAYATRFRLPVRNGLRVDRLFRRGSRFAVRAAELEMEADQVVVAMGDYQRPKLPSYSAQFHDDTVQMHSRDYRNPAQLKPGAVLVVGAGNSGADIALETAQSGHATWLAGPDTGEVPFRPDSFLGRHVLGPLLLRFVFHRVLTVRTPLGRKARPRMLKKPVPLIRVKARDLQRAGVKRVPRVVGVRQFQPVLEDGRTLDVSNIIWCSGFSQGFDWIDVDVFDECRLPVHDSGIARHTPGLYFVGLKFLHAMSSSMIHGVSNDAQRIVGVVVERARVSAGK
jgi:putative flavoprotein involved in K+ transport